MADKFFPCPNILFLFSSLFFISATPIACKKTCFSERRESPTFNTPVCSHAFEPMPLSLKEKILLPGLRLF